MPGLRLDLDGPVATITVDRPRALNAIGLETMQELDEAVSRLAASSVSVVVVTGAGTRSFVSGGDLKELEAVRSLEQAQKLAESMRRTLDRLGALPIPVLGALNGDAYGGGAEIAIACDFRIAAAHARIGFTQVQLAIMPAWGGIERLAAITGRARALYLLSTGRVLEAEEARYWGLVDEVVPSANFERRWRELAAQIAAVPRAALTGIKAAVDSVTPSVSDSDANAAIRRFAEVWTDSRHWAAAAELEQARRRAKGQT